MNFYLLFNSVYQIVQQGDLFVDTGLCIHHVVKTVYGEALCIPSLAPIHVVP